MQTKITRKTTALPALLFIACFSSHALYAQDATTSKMSNDEQAIRSLVKQQNEGKNVIKMTDNVIFVSGAYPKPIVGKEQNEALRKTPESNSRLNFTQKIRMERLEIAKGGDMAYDFGYADLAWDTPEKKHISFEASYVRIWRKVNGEWKGEVFFARPNESTDSASK